MAGWYNRGKRNLAAGDLDWDAADVRAMLVTSGYVFNADHNFVDDLVPATNELQGGTYVRKTTTRTVTENDANDRAELNSTTGGTVWTALTATGTPNALVYYKEGASDAARELVSYHEFTPTPTNGGDFTVSHASNIATNLN